MDVIPEVGDQTLIATPAPQVVYNMRNGVTRSRSVSYRLIFENPYDVGLLPC